MESAWTFDSEPPATGPTAVTLFEQTSFCRSNRAGDIDPDRPEGLFVDDTRVLSRWQLTVDGDDIEPVTVMHPQPYHALFVGRARVAGRPESPLLVERRRYVGDGMREDVVVRNVSADLIAVNLHVAVTADFADLFQVKSGRAIPAPAGRVVRGQHDLRVERPGGQGSGVRIVVAANSSFDVVENTIVFSLTIDPRSEWTASFGVEVTDAGARPMAFPPDQPVQQAAPVRRTARWLAEAATLTCPDATLTHTWQTSLRDLDSLRVYALGDSQPPTLAAGAPWFMAVFGRDSLFASWMALPLDPSLALGTLKTLAFHQGVKSNPATEEAPGRMLHEIRNGAEAKQTLGGAGVYYAAADTTQLFVALLGEAVRWGLSAEHLDELLPAADRALEWVSGFTERAGDGFVTYRRSSELGLPSQGWKDSPAAVCFADGRIASAPIALCEVQSYAYAGYVARADIARLQGDDATERRWRDAADRLREAFNRRFWLPDRGWYAVAIDGDGEPVDALTSNIGHCLWSGIVDDDKARSVADHLMSPDLFTGWGVRTLAASMARYNPMSYHRGCVWPWENAVIAAGLARYGFTAEAARLAAGMLDAAACFDGRLPELFCGFGRDEFAEPVPFPAACSPQSWASTAPLYLLRTLLGMNPSASDASLRLAPALPARMLPLRLDGIRLGSARVTVEATADGVAVSGLPAGMRVAPD